MKTSSPVALVLGLALLGLVAQVPRAWAGGPVNNCPTANGQNLPVNQDSVGNPLQLTASDPNGDALTYIVTAPSAHGTVVLNAQTGAGTYTPAPGYCGPDSFRFKVTDGQCDSPEATVAINVVCDQNECPVADPLDVTVAQNGSVNFQLPASDGDDDPLQYSVTQAPAHGVVVVNGQTGAASYTPNRGYCGPDSFKFRVSDGQCNSAEATVSITVTCPPPALGCRVTGGALSSSGVTDPNQSFEITTAQGGGQVGAPCGSVGCFEEAGHILGVWHHSRKKKRGSFLAKQYTSLACSCLNADGTASFGAPCRPDDPDVGPEPRPAPANVACFSGIGNYSDTSTRRRSTRVAFRVEVEDHGEPGAGGTAPDDEYRIRIWIPQGSETVQQLAADACCCNPEPTNGASRRPDVDDGGPITRGNIQIHPQTPAEFEECPVPDDSCPLCGNGQVDGDEGCDPPGSVCRGGCNPVTQTCVDFDCNPDCTCPPPVCGDQFVDEDEECDPPDSTCGDGRTCGATCACEQVCGNGNVEPGEDCEPPDTLGGCTDGRSCDSNCQCVQECGNGTREPGEDCEPPSTLGGCDDGLSCDATCQCIQQCGNGLREGTEECEPPNTPGGCSGPNGVRSCDANCACFTACGNEVREAGEECEVTPDTPRGGCGPGEECTNCACVPTCGNGEHDMGEQCGDPGTVGCGTGSSCVNCRCVANCGNGTLDSGEQCDPPNTQNGCGGNVSCNATCQCIETCGNRFCGAGEDSCSCPTDCPDTPGLCSQCECGGIDRTTGCSCDPAECDVSSPTPGCCVNVCSACPVCSGGGE